MCLHLPSIRLKCIMATVVLLAAGLASPAAAGPEKVAVAYPVQGIAIDGDLSDWPADAIRYPLDLQEDGESLSGRDDFSGGFTVAYNAAENALYVAVEVADDSVIRSSSTSPDWYAQDGVELYLHGHRIHSYGPTQYWFRALQAGVYGPGASEDVAVAASWRDDGYQIEIRVDMDMASGRQLALEPGTRLGFDLAVWDLDRDRTNSWMAWSRGARKHVDPHRLGRLALLPAGAGMDEVLAIVERTADTGANLAARARRRSVGLQMFSCGVLFAFTLLHLLLFLFDPSTKANLFYALYTGLITAAIFVGFQLQFTAVAGSDFLAHVRATALLVVSFFGLCFLYSLFNPRPPRRFWVLTGLVGLLTYAVAQQGLGRGPVFVSGTPAAIVTGIVGIGLFCEILIALFNAVRQGKEGAWIIGIGFTVFALSTARFIYLPARSQAAMDSSALYWLFIPLISMSVYLARSVGRTNRVLSRQLQEIEQLSRTTQEQYQQIQAQNEQIQEANRLKSDFLARMSHDLRTPMNAIIGYTRILLRKTREQLEERQYRNLENVNISARNLLTLINDILDISKIESGRLDVKPETVDVGAVARECAEAVESLARPGVQIRYELAETPPLQTDPDRLRRVLMNLLSNSVKYTEEGSVTVSVQLRGEWLEISVADTGVGIPADDLPHIFDEFRQVERADGTRREGTGLGLAIVRKSVDLLGGTIMAASEVGQGSVFTVRLRDYEAGASDPGGDSP